MEHPVQNADLFDIAARMRHLRDSEDLPWRPFSLPHRLALVRGDALRQNNGGELQFSVRDNTTPLHHLLTLIPASGISSSSPKRTERFVGVPRLKWLALRPHSAIQ